MLCSFTSETRSGKSLEPNSPAETVRFHIELLQSPRGLTMMFGIICSSVVAYFLLMSIANYGDNGM
jgi:hypothetical protein